MCSNWPHASAQRPFVVARVAGWGLPLIPGQVFISKGRGRAKKKKDKQKKKLSTSAANYWKNIKVFSVCVKRKKRKEGRGGRRRDSRLMAWLSVSWRIVASRGEARQKLTCRRWLQVERGICLAAKTLYLFLVFSFFPPRPLFIFTSFTISLRLPLFLLLLPVPFFPLLLHAVEAVHKDK